MEYLIIAHTTLGTLVDQGHLLYEFVFNVCNNLQAYGRSSTINIPMPSSISVIVADHSSPRVLEEYSIDRLRK